MKLRTKKYEMTDRKLKSLKAKDKTYRIADRDRLTIEVRTTGNIRFLHRFQWEQKPQTMTIGHSPEMSLAEARKKSLSLHCMVRAGIDPRTTLLKNNQEKLFQEFGEKWFSKKSTNWREKTKKKHRISLDRDIYPIIGNIPIDEITKSNLLQVFRPHDDKGHTEIVHRLYYRIKAVFDLANAMGLSENYPFNGLKTALTPKPKIKNHLSIHPSKAHQMMSDIQKCRANIVVKLYIELLPMLFTRPSELRLAKWSEFDFKLREWNIPEERMKMKEPHWVPLSNQSIELLQKLSSITGHTPYVFNSPRSENAKPISETSARKLLATAGYKGIHALHGFRSLSCTVVNSETSFRADAIEAQQARRIQGVRGVYMRADYKDERRKIIEWFSHWLTAQHTN